MIFYFDLSLFAHTKTSGKCEFFCSKCLYLQPTDIIMLQIVIYHMKKRRKKLFCNHLHKYGNNDNDNVYNKCDNWFLYSAFPVKIKAFHSVLLPWSMASESILHSQCTFSTPWGAFWPVAILQDMPTQPQYHDSHPTWSPFVHLGQEQQNSNLGVTLKKCNILVCKILQLHDTINRPLSAGGNFSGCAQLFFGEKKTIV